MIQTHTLVSLLVALVALGSRMIALAAPSAANSASSQQTSPIITSITSDILSELDRSLSLQDEPIRTSHYHFEKQMDPQMQLCKFNSTTSYRGNMVVCNDGSSPGYYNRLNNHSKSWIIYLQGGGFCGSDEACQQRWRRSPQLMSSNFWPKSKSVDGILSSEPKDNPFLWNANHVYVPYCSSDSWSGLQSSRTTSASLRSLQHHNNNNLNSNNNNEVAAEHLTHKVQRHHQHHHGPSQRQSFAFMGSQILERVFESLFEDLPRESSLYEAKFILLAGDSAGATGVILNLDKLNKFVQLKFANLRPNCSQEEAAAAAAAAASNSARCDPARHAPVFRGLADSGWFLDNEPYDYMEQYSGPTGATSATSTMASSAPNMNFQQNYHTQSNQATQYSDDMDASQASQEPQQQQQQPTTQQAPVDCERQRCNPLQSIRQAMLYWNGQVPASCALRHQLEPWRCYFGYRVYQTLKTPLFVVQWLYDEAQLIVDNIGRPDTIGQWNYVNRLVNDLRASLENVTALFAPSCLSHSLIIKHTWNQININGLKLPHVLNSWQEETLAHQPTIEALLSPLLSPYLLPDNSDFYTNNNNSNSNVNSNNSFQQILPASSFSMRSASVQHAQADTRNSDLSIPARSASGMPRSGRPRKRKRNNQQQQQQQPQQQQQKQTNTQNQPNRLGRSTAISVEGDLSTTLLNNNVPDILSMSFSSRSSLDLGDRFRLIDSCGWPQCNRDCPLTEQEFNSRPLLPYR